MLKHGRRMLVAAVLVAGAGLIVRGSTVQSGVAAASAASAAASAPAGSPTVVTLITGDRVALRDTGDGRPVVTVDPADRGSAQVGFQTLTSGSHVFVVPSDAAGFLGAPLDLGLFDVTALAAAGYGDQTTPLALDVTATGDATVPSLERAGPGTARQSRGEAARFGRALSAEWWARKQGKPGQGLFAGIERIALAGSASSDGSLLPPGQPAGKLHTLTVKGFDAKGQKIWGSFGVVYNVDDGTRFLASQSFFNGTFSYSVPAGHYQITALVPTETGPGSADWAFVTAPEVTVKASTIVVLDARKTSRVGAVVPDPSSQVVGEMTLQRDPATGPSFATSFVTFGPAPIYVSPTPPVTVGQQEFYPYIRLGDADGSLDRYLYDLQFAYVGAIPDDLVPTLGRDDLATVDATYHSAVPGRGELEGRIALAPWMASVSGIITSVAAPSTRTEYVLPHPDLRWQQTVVTDGQEFAGFTNDLWRDWKPGDHATADWSAQPMPPGLQNEPVAAQPCPVCRSGDTLSTLIWPSVDRDGHWMLPDPGALTTLSLYRDGELVDTQPSGIAQFPLSPEAATYRLDLDVQRDAPWWPTTTRTHTTWTFGSAQRPPDTLPEGWTCGGKGGGGGGPKGIEADGKGGGGDGCSFEPLLFATYDTHAGADDVVPAGEDATLDIAVARQAHAPGAPIGDLTLDVSFDDGAIWTPATVTALGDGRFRAEYAQPELGDTSGFASLRLHVSDAEGSSLDQTITRAYPLSVTPPLEPGGGAAGGGRSAVPACAAPATAPFVQCMALISPASFKGGDPEPFAGYGPADLASAYRLPPGAGAGKTVAIVDAYDNPNAEADLAVYRERWGLPPCTTANGCFRKVNQRGEPDPLPAPDPGWGLEISLDLDAVSATCPSCKILLVEADSASLLDLAPGVETAVRLGADAISNSYGSRGEFSGEELFERFFKHTGVAITVSSGDYGYGNGLILTGGVSYPGSSAFVTSVGGTALVRDGSERGWTESAWVGSTSGCSAYIHKPGWQKDRLCDKRSVADVAAVGDPATGLATYDTFGFDGWLVVGGTSLSSPVVASVYAMAGHTGETRYGVTPYRAGSGLFDVVGGSNGECGGSYLCTGLPGYDGPTGLGTPDGLGGF